MTPEEAIEILGDFEKQAKAKADGAYQTNVGKMACDMAIEAIKEIQQYRKIGTVEECREAVEKQKPKKPHIDANELLGDTSYECPNCGTEMMLIDRNRIQWGHIQKYCECCGQAILRMEGRGEKGGIG